MSPGSGEPVPAATVVLVRENRQADAVEVLLLRRNQRLVFHGGHWVFPGGRIDQEDFQRSASGLEYHAALEAAVRETREESGIEISTEALIHTAHWTTPPSLPRRFSTWFFLCPLRLPVEVRVDNDEILDYRWISPQAALDEASAEKFVLPRPTRATLEDIRGFTDLDSLLGHVQGGEIRVFPDDSRHYRPAEMGYLPD